MRARLVAATLLAFPCVAAPAGAAQPIMPLSEVRSGMRCTGASVVRGTQIATFDVGVVDVVDGDPARIGPRILVDLAGPAVERTGIGPGFSGSPVTCPDASGVPRVIGAISESVGEYGGEVALATPIEAVLGDRPDAPPQAVPARAAVARARPLAGPLTISGVRGPLARALQSAGRRAGRPILAVPAGPLGSYPVQTLRPGASMAVGYSAGAFSVGAVGTVAYTDGDAVWGFGHPNDGVGRRSLLLQDAYVFRVISNPNVVEEMGTTFKLAAAGHPVGTLSNDALDGVAGRVGGLPSTIPLDVHATDLDTGARQDYATQVAVETDLDDPMGASPLSFVAPVAVAQAGTAVLGSTPARATGTMCVRLAIRELDDPIRLCNRYVTGSLDESGVGSLLAARAGQDVLDLVTELDGYKAGRVHVTGMSVTLDARRGQRQAFLRDVRLPARVRPGQTVTARVRLQAFRGGTLKRRYRLKIPAWLGRGTRELRFAGADIDGGDEDLLGGLADVVTVDLDAETRPGAGSLGPTSIEALARRLRRIQRYDGVTLRAGGQEEEGFRDGAWRISGRASASTRIVTGR
jgi:hypothetical protein